MLSNVKHLIISHLIYFQVSTNNNQEIINNVTIKNHPSMKETLQILNNYKMVNNINKKEDTFNLLIKWNKEDFKFLYIYKFFINLLPLLLALVFYKIMGLFNITFETTITLTQDITIGNEALKLLISFLPFIILIIMSNIIYLFLIKKIFSNKNNVNVYFQYLIPFYINSNIMVRLGDYLYMVFKFFILSMGIIFLMDEINQYGVFLFVICLFIIFVVLDLIFLSAITTELEIRFIYIENKDEKQYAFDKEILDIINECSINNPNVNFFNLNIEIQNKNITSFKRLSEKKDLSFFEKKNLQRLSEKVSILYNINNKI